MMALALALVIGAVVVSATLRSHPEQVVAAEVATKSPGKAPRSSSGKEGDATKKSSSEKESPRFSSGEQEKESLGYSSSSSGLTRQNNEETNTSQAVRQQEAEPLKSQ